MSTWYSDSPPPAARLSAMSLALAIVRVVMIAGVIYTLLICLILARLMESSLKRRVLSPFIVQLACKLSLGIMRLKVRVSGTPMAHPGAVVCNHSSWLDIFVLNSVQRIYFVSKAEVSKWPVIGLFARITGTVFIERRKAHAKKHNAQFEERLLNNDRLLFFPEGTSTDGRRLLPFKSTLFQAFFAPNLASSLWIQPASVIYHAPKGEPDDFFGWWGDMDFGGHFLKTLGAQNKGSVEIILHEPVAISDFASRKTLAAHCETEVRKALEKRIVTPASDG